MDHLVGKVWKSNWLPSQWTFELTACIHSLDDPMNKTQVRLFQQKTTTRVDTLNDKSRHDRNCTISTSEGSFYKRVAIFPPLSNWRLQQLLPIKKITDAVQCNLLLKCSIFVCGRRPRNYSSSCYCSWIFCLIYALSTSTTLLPPIFKIF